MADTRYFQSTATMPQVDYGAIYDRAVARREQREQRELDYLNSFQQVRGALTPGGKKLGQESFQLIQDSLNSGDMSVEAQRERTQLYNEYKDIMAAGLEYKNKLDDVSKRIYADPSKYNRPDELTAQIDALRNQDFTDITDVDNAISNIPSLAQYKRYSAPVYSINDAVQDYRKGVSVDQFYNPETGELDNESLKQSIGEYFDFQNLDDDDIYGIIASDLRSKGLLSNTASDSARILEIVGDDERAKASLVSYIDKVYNASLNSFNTDIQTAAEKANQKSQASMQASIFDYKAPEKNLLTVVPRIEPKEGQFEVTKKNATTKEVGVGLIANIQDGKPYYEDDQGVKRTVEKVGLDLSGNKIVVITYDQPVLGTEGREKHKVTEVVSWGDIEDSGWNNMKQVNRIQATLNDMQSNYRPGDVTREGPQEDPTQVFETITDTTESKPKSAVSQILGEISTDTPLDNDLPMSVNDPNFTPYRPTSEGEANRSILGETKLERPDIRSGSDRTGVARDPIFNANETENLNENEVVVEALPEPAQEDESRTLVEKQNEEQDKMRSLPNSREYYNQLVDVAEIVDELDKATLDYGNIPPSSVTQMTEESLQDLVSRNEIDLGKYSVKEFKDLITEYQDDYPLFFKSALDQDGQMELVEV